MSGWDALHCANHPERIALERCEVCGKPLCAYCLYYTEDGQRLCREHAEIARQRGAHIEEPGVYADQLIGAQVGAQRKHKRGMEVENDGLYRGNTHDVLALLGLVITLTALGACCGAGYCLPGVGLVISLIALLNAKKAFNPRRTRRLAVAGLIFSGVWVLVVGACITIYGLSFRQMVNVIQQPVNLGPLLATDTPAVSPTVYPTDPPPTSVFELTPSVTSEPASAPTFGPSTH